MLDFTNLRCVNLKRRFFMLNLYTEGILRVL